MKFSFFVLAFCFASLISEAQWSTTTPYTYLTPNTTNKVGIGTTTPSMGRLQIGAPGNLDTNKIIFPGVYNFEKARFGQYPNGAAGLEFVNHVSATTSYGVRLLANVDVGGAGMQFQYAPAASTDTGLHYSTSMFLRAADGFVGIGTVNPQSLLAVKGTITAQKVVVIQTGWSDYVFDSAYNLRPLPSVESFIQSNKHLPDVPSAMDVKKDGINLGDNQATLLKKVEELTLYLIEQSKQIAEQNRKIAALENEVSGRRKER